MPLFKPGSRIEDYELLRHAATGAMSEVYEGRHVASGRRVAVKVMLQELCGERELVVRFLNEGHFLQQLQHTCIVTTFACDTLPEGPPYMVLEWLPVDLHQALSREGSPIASLIALQIACQLADALDMLHSRGLIHRDLKPSNVLLARADPSSWEVKLADLGLAKVLPGNAEPGTQHISTGGSTLLGTWDYMAPEQWVQSKNVDSKADVYALGVLLFQLLTGRLPFIAEEQKDLMCFHLLHEPPLDQLEGLAPAVTRELVARMLKKKPPARPTMREVLEQLRAQAEP
jgi:eukaryotic-like serine/threonine-protein kinase